MADSHLLGPLYVESDLLYLNDNAITGRVYDANNAELFSALDPIAADDSTANSAAIVARMDALVAAGLKGNIKLPAGQIRLGSVLTWPAGASDIGLVGEGMFATELIADYGGSPSTSSAGIVISGATSRVRIADLTIRGTADSDAGGPYDLVKVNNHSGSDIIVQNVRFKYGRHAGFRTTGTVAGASGYAVIDCQFEDLITANMPAVNSGGGILIDDETSDTRIAGCHFRRIGSATTSHAVYISGSKGGTLTGCVFDQTVNANTRLQIITGAAGWSVSNNVFHGDPLSNGCFNYLGGSYNTFSGNAFYNSRLRVAGARLLYIGNVFAFTGATDVATRAIESSSDVADSSFIGNYMYAVNKDPVWRFIHYARNFSRNVVENNVVVNALLFINASGTNVASSTLNVFRNNKVYYDGFALADGKGLIHNDDATWLINSLYEGNTFDTGAGAGYAIFDRSGNSNIARNNHLQGSAAIDPDITNYLQAESPDRIRLLYGSAVWDPADIATGTGVQTTITVTGAVAGDPVAVSHTLELNAGLILTAQVTTADTVKVTLWNESGGNLNIGSGTLAVVVTHKV